MPGAWNGVIMSWLLAPLAVLLGAVLTSQVATNAQLGKALDNPYIPATVNMAFGLIVTVILTWALTPQWPSREMMREAPWYLWPAGGVLGVTYLTGNILLAPKLGAGALSGSCRGRAAYILSSARPFRLAWICTTSRRCCSLGWMFPYDRWRFSYIQVLREHG